MSWPHRITQCGRVRLARAKFDVRRANVAVLRFDCDSKWPGTEVSYYSRGADERVLLHVAHHDSEDPFASATVVEFRLPPGRWQCIARSGKWAVTVCIWRSRR